VKVLIVEDKTETIKDIMAHCEEKEWEFKICAFDGFERDLTEFAPDAVVLDWKYDADDSHRGSEVLEYIWTTSFRPVVIFSAIADAIVLDEKYKSSTLIRMLSKGDEEPVIQYLDTICPFVPVISTLKADFNDALIQALNSIEMMRKIQPLPDNVLRYVFAKRVSTYFDKECAEETPPPWIQYTYPAINKSLCVCDIIRSIPAEGNVDKIGNAEEYKVILTPSCDIAQCKVSHALCANCYPKTRFHNYPTNENPTERQLSSIISNLNTGYNSSLVSLPSIPEVLPYLTVDLKKVALLPIEQISLQANKINIEHKYCRVASVDSPYREQIVWAYMINSCRPGMPNRDMNVWAKGLMMP
jgi:CTP synthase